MKYFLTLILGAILGGVGAYFLFVGAPRAGKPPGEAVRTPDAGGPPPGTAVVELDEQFFNTLLGSVFRDVGQPAFRLASGAPAAAPEGPGVVRYVEAQAGGACQNEVVLAAEGGGVQTGVRLQNGEVLAPLAFSGSYNLFGNCVNFRGTAEANITLRFAAEEQTLYGQLNVRGVNLEGMSPLFSGPVTAFVQGAINQRVNPLVLMRGQPLTLSFPVQAAGGSLQARARDVREETKDGRLRLYVTYDFKGSKGAATPPS
jgi:hypothetical protein